jgi:hypothetical protein
LPWANNATAMPRRQNTEAVKMRRLKKADCEVDFFFIDEVSFPCEVECRSYRIRRKHVNTFLKFFIPERVFAEQRPTRKASVFGRSCELRCDPASKILRDAAPLAAEAGNPEANYL